MIVLENQKQAIKQLLQSGNAAGQDIEAARQILRQKAKDDFWFFQYHVYGNKDTDNPLHHDMCARWQKRSKTKFSLWLVPRFHLKTSCFTEAGTLWELVRNPDQRVLIVNAVLENAKDFLANIRNCIETNEIFRWLFPEYCYDLAPKNVRKRCQVGRMRVDLPCSIYAGKKEGNIEIMGVEASLVSKHYDLMIFDDPVNDVNTTSKEYRDKIEKWYKNALQLRHSTKSRVRLIGTRWAFDDLYGRIIKAEMERRERQKEEGKKVKPRYWIYHRQVIEKVDEGGETIAGYDNVVPIWKERFSAEDIEELREENGSYIFSCQFMNNPVSSEDAVFKYSDIQEIDEYLIPENCVNFIATDTAVENTEHGDFWVITVASFDSKGNMYVREVIRDKLLPSTFLDYVAELTVAWNAQRVAIETTAFQKTLFKIYQEWCAGRGYNIPWAEMKRGNTSKRKRIFSLQPRVERGAFYIQSGIKNYEHIIDEMVTFPKPVHDDILDTLADLEALYYAAPEELKAGPDPGTFDAVFGKLEELTLEDPDKPLSSVSCIDQTLLRSYG